MKNAPPFAKFSEKGEMLSNINATSGQVGRSFHSLVNWLPLFKNAISP
jgi:hypothetical protein